MKRGRSRSRVKLNMLTRGLMAETRDRTVHMFSFEVRTASLAGMGHRKIPNKLLEANSYNTEEKKLNAANDNEGLQATLGSQRESALTRRQLLLSNAQEIGPSITLGRNIDKDGESMAVD